MIVNINGTIESPDVNCRQADDCIDCILIHYTARDGKIIIQKKRLPASNTDGYPYRLDLTYRIILICVIYM